MPECVWARALRPRVRMFNTYLRFQFRCVCVCVFSVVLSLDHASVASFDMTFSLDMLFLCRHVFHVFTVVCVSLVFSFPLTLDLVSLDLFQCSSLDKCCFHFFTVDMFLLFLQTICRCSLYLFVCKHALSFRHIIL